MDAKHTPGPWQSQDEGGVFLYDHPWSVENHEASTVSFAPVHRNGCVIALVVRTDWNDSQLERDARLIAAFVGMIAGSLMPQFMQNRQEARHHVAGLKAPTGQHL